MLNESMLLRKLRRELGDDIFDALDPTWFIDILNEDTLLRFSLNYPFIVKGIMMQVSDAIPSRHPQKGTIATYKYKIPNEMPDMPFIGIENFYFPGNFMKDIYTGGAPFATDAMMGAIRSYIPNPQIRRTAIFEPPDIAVVDPIPMQHIPFSLDMQRVRKLNEFPLYYYDMIVTLFLLDIKWAIYNKFKNARDSATLGGVEVNTFISEYSNANDERNTFLEKIDKDYFKNPERYASFMQHDAG